MKFIHFDNVDSTNAEAARRASDTIAHGSSQALWISADRQTAGRGRRGRTWVSRSGNLFCSGLFKTQGQLQDDARLSFAAALAVAEMLEHYIAPDLIKIKWPNDILVAGKKIAGILLESGRENQHHWLIVGIGINVIDTPDLTDYPTTHLLAHIDDKDLSGPEPVFTGTGPMTALLAARFSHWRSIYVAEGFAPLRTAWLLRAQGIGGPVTAVLAERTVKGIAMGLDMDGALEIIVDDGQCVKIHAGDVFFS